MTKSAAAELSFDVVLTKALWRSDVSPDVELDDVDDDDDVRKISLSLDISIDVRPKDETIKVLASSLLSDTSDQNLSRKALDGLDVDLFSVQVKSQGSKFLFGGSSWSFSGPETSSIEVRSSLNKEEPEDN